MNSHFRNYPQADVNEEFMEATRIGNFEKIKYLLTSPELKVHADIAHNEYNGFINACGLGDLKIISYLLTSPDLKKKADIHAKDDSGLYWAARMGNFNVVKYLLTSHELKKHACISVGINSCFETACENNHKEIIMFFLESKEMNNKLSQAFMDACKYEKFDIAEFIIFELGLKKNQKINDYLKEKNLLFISNMFNTRELNQSLNKELVKNCSIDKRNKLKL
jgi:ankyrin repeat protein